MFNIFSGGAAKAGPNKASATEVQDGGDLPEETVNDVVQAGDLVSGSSVANSAGGGAPSTEEQEQKPDNDTSVAPAAVEADATVGDNSDPALAPPTRPEAPKLPRFSFKSLGFIYGQQGTLSSSEEHAKKEKAKEASKRISFIPLSRSDRRARETAIVLQNTIVGPVTLSRSLNARKSKPATKSQLEQVRSQLMQPKSANKVIAQLRQLPVPGALVSLKKDGVELQAEWGRAGGAIHAVCLPQTEAELDTNHFDKLANSGNDFASSSPNVTDASLQGIMSFFSELRIVDFLNDPLGIGQDGNGVGIFSGALPTAEAIADGFVKITPELMGLGYATGKAVQPDHTGLHPPLDRMSVITYWWGLEIPMPEPTMRYLDNAKSISHALVNVLTALSALDAGVREILPFVRYISQFIDFEWGAIKNQDKGKGVVCAATWIMPAALVPRPWDFPDPPPPAPRTANGEQNTSDHASANQPLSDGGLLDDSSAIQNRNTVVLESVSPDARLNGKSADIPDVVLTNGNDEATSSETIDDKPIPVIIPPVATDSDGQVVILAGL